jgi:hypothetical protein
MAKYKPNPAEPKYLTRQVTQRFLSIMDEIILHYKPSRGAYRTVKAFCASIGANHTYFSQFGDEKFDRNVTLEMCAAICLIHHVTPTWILLGKGDKFTEEGIKFYTPKVDTKPVKKAADKTPAKKVAAKKVPAKKK